MWPELKGKDCEEKMEDEKEDKDCEEKIEDEKEDNDCEEKMKDEKEELTKNHEDNEKMRLMRSKLG